MKPKVVDRLADRRPIILFTDGAAESSDPAVLTYDLVTIGGVAIDTATGSIAHFGDSVPGRIVDEWRAAGILQGITQAHCLCSEIPFRQIMGGPKSHFVHR